jgi:BlaI family transcriptional regulator, penicillinase repressor
MNDLVDLALTPRERSVLDAVVALGEADAAQVTAALDGIATHEAVRAALRALERKRVLEHRAEGRRYVYRPASAPAPVRASAMRRLVATFFGGSPVRAAAALLQDHDAALDPEELDRLAAEVEAARRRAGRGA